MDMFLITQCFPLQSLKKPTDDTYREIAVKDKQRRRNKNDQVYQVCS